MPGHSSDDLPRSWHVEADDRRWRLVSTWRRRRSVAGRLVRHALFVAALLLLLRGWHGALAAGSLPSVWTLLATPVVAFWGFIAAAGLVNRTIVEVDRERVTATIRPIRFTMQPDRGVERARVVEVRVTVHAEQPLYAGVAVACADGTLVPLVAPTMGRDAAAALQHALAGQLAVAAPPAPPDPVRASEPPARGGARWWLAALVAATVLYFIAWPIGRDAYIFYNGVDATATIVAVRDTGSRFNRLPILEFRVTVHPPDGGPAYEALAESPTSPLTIGKMQPGAQIRVKYLPGAPSWISIEEP